MDSSFIIVLLAAAVVAIVIFAIRQDSKKGAEHLQNAYAEEGASPLPGAVPPVTPAMPGSPEVPVVTRLATGPVTPPPAAPVPGVQTPSVQHTIYAFRRENQVAMCPCCNGENGLSRTTCCICGYTLRRGW